MGREEEGGSLVGTPTHPHKQIQNGGLASLFQAGAGASSCRARFFLLRAFSTSAHVLADVDFGRPRLARDYSKLDRAGPPARWPRTGPPRSASASFAWLGPFPPRNAATRPIFHPFGLTPIPFKTPRKHAQGRKGGARAWLASRRLWPPAPAAISLSRTASSTEGRSSSRGHGRAP